MTTTISPEATEVRDILDESRLVVYINEMYQSKKKTFANLSSNIYAHPKSKERCNSSRKLGLLHYLKGDHEEAANLFSESIASAPNDSAELVAAYADRSSCTLKMELYEWCLLDINRAASNKLCVENVRNKLQKMKIECLAERSGDDRDVDLTKFGFNNYKVKNDATDPHDSGCPTDPKFFEDWSSLRSYEDIQNYSHSMSTKLAIKRSPEGSNNIVASEDIEPGTALIAEKFFVTSLNHDLRFKHCSHCLVRCYALIPCPTCAETMFCSEHCLKRAIDQYHRTECQIIKIYKHSGEDQGDILALRAFLVQTDQGKRVSEFLKKFPPELPFASDYISSLRKLKTNKERLISSIQKALSSILDIIITLQSLSFFEQNDNLLDRLSDAELFSTLLMVLNYISMGKNRFRLLGHTDRIGMTEDWIGYGVYVFQNCIPRSCDPNTVCFVSNRHRVLYSFRSIKEGETLTLGTPVDYAINSLEDRTKWLSADGAVCRCEACLNNWPLLDSTYWWKRKTRFIKEDMSRKKMKNWMKKRHKSHICNFGIPDWRAESVVEMCQEIKLWLEYLYENLRAPCYEIISLEILFGDFLKMFHSDLHCMSIQRIDTFYHAVDNLEMCFE